MSSEEETGEHRERNKRDRSEECEDDVSKKAKVAERPDDNQNSNNNPNPKDTHHTIYTGGHTLHYTGTHTHTTLPTAKCLHKKEPK